MSSNEPIRCEGKIIENNGGKQQSSLCTDNTYTDTQHNPDNGTVRLETTLNKPFPWYTSPWSSNAILTTLTLLYMHSYYSSKKQSQLF